MEIHIVNKYEKIQNQNVSNYEYRATENLKKDELIMILPADKGRVTVLMIKNDYYEKCNQLLRHDKTYQTLKSDPIYNLRKNLCLKDLKDRKVIDHTLHTCMKLYPTLDHPWLT